MYSNQQNSRSEYSLLRQITQDMKELKAGVADLRENRVKPEQVYTREVIDGMMKDISDKLTDVQNAIAEQRNQLYKNLTIAGAAVTMIILIAQHVTVH